MSAVSRFVPRVRLLHQQTSVEVTDQQRELGVLKNRVAGAEPVRDLVPQAPQQRAVPPARGRGRLPDGTHVVVGYERCRV